MRAGPLFRFFGGYRELLLNIAVRCETAIKTNGPLYKHPQLGVCPNLLNVLSLN